MAFRWLLQMVFAFKDGLNAKVAKIGERKNPEEHEEFDKNLADALKEILSSETKRMQLGKNRRDRYPDCYQFCKMQTGCQELVKSLLIYQTSSFMLKN